MGILPGRGQTTFNNTGGPGKARRGGWSAARNPGRRQSPRDPEGRSRRVGRALHRARGLTKRDLGAGEGARWGRTPSRGSPAPSRKFSKSPRPARRCAASGGLSLALRLVTEQLLRTQRRSSGCSCHQDGNNLSADR